MKKGSSKVHPTEKVPGISTGTERRQNTQTNLESIAEAFTVTVLQDFIGHACKFA